MNYLQPDKTRREFQQIPLRRKTIPDTPLPLFTNWLAAAYEAPQLLDPTAMSLATVDEHQHPYQRLVLLKGYNEDSLVFYTDYGSRKSIHIANNSAVSVLFPWHTLDRQVLFLGYATRLNQLKNQHYFLSRPKLSQIAALSSQQSMILTSRDQLEQKFNQLQQEFADANISPPSFWGGYCIHYHSVEFWQGGPHRLHDRFFYRRCGNNWQLNRLSP